jgi:hypothetical protein
MVVHDGPIRGRRRQPDEIYGRGHDRDPAAWLKRKRRQLARQRRSIHRRRQARGDAEALVRRGFAPGGSTKGEGMDEHVFAGQPDERQTEAAVISPEHSLFRKRYRSLAQGEVELHDAIKDKADELARLIGQINPAVAMRLGVDIVPNPADPYEMNRDPANVTLAIRHLEDAVYRAVKALTA